MATATRTPKDVPINVRNLQFNRNAKDHGRWWHGNDPIATAFFNAMSCMFPEGEKFFMDSVRAFKNDVSPEMKEQIRGFIAQEAVHSREHAEFNKLAADAGYDVAKLEAGTRRSLGVARKRGKLEQLAVTCALEHFTALLGNALLEANSADLDGAPEDAKRMWSWHAMEEIEHKAVCYDVFLDVTKKWPGFARYGLRTGVMVAATLILFHRMGANMSSLYREDGINTPKTWLKTAKYLLWSPGALRRIALPYLSYYKPGFHPWDHDDRELLHKTEAQYGLAA